MPPPDEIASDENAFSDADTNALHLLPLAIVPLETSGLKRARLRKNSQLTSSLELFSGAGVGLIEPENTLDVFDLEGGQSHPDFRTIAALSELSSYDVYSLRIGLRRLGIDVEGAEALRLTPSKERELTSYMRAFTRPLLERIYGSGAADGDFSQLLRLFASPEASQARANLKSLTDDLNIELSDIPNFLTIYADVYLSLAYYRQCHDELVVKFEDFQKSIQFAMEDFKRDTQFLKLCSKMIIKISRVISSINCTLDVFNEQTENMWEHISDKKYRAMEQSIKDVHTDIGAALCALSVKMRAWESEGRPGAARSSSKCREGIISHINPNLDRVSEVKCPSTTPWIT